MLSLYNNANLNNMYINQNYGYGQSVLNPYSFQQPQTSVFGGYQQQSGIDLNSIFSLLFTALSGNNSYQPITNNTGLNINNWGNIGNINVGEQAPQNPFGGLLSQLISLLKGPTLSDATSSTSDKKPVTVEQETVEVNPKEKLKGATLAEMWYNAKFNKNNMSSLRYSDSTDPSELLKNAQAFVDESFKIQDSTGDGKPDEDLVETFKKDPNGILGKGDYAANNNVIAAAGAEMDYNKDGVATKEELLKYFLTQDKNKDGVLDWND